VKKSVVETSPVLASAPAELTVKTYWVSSKYGVRLMIDAFSEAEAKRRYKDSLQLSQARPDDQFEAVLVEG
jgi:hypothetical protein